MARRLTTGFELGELIEHNGTKLGSPAVQSTYRRTGTYALYCQGANVSLDAASAFTFSVTDHPAELYFRVALMYRNTLNYGPVDKLHCFIAFFDAATCQVAIGVHAADFNLVVARGGSEDMGHDGTRIASGTAVLHHDVWYVIEGYVKIANSGGQVTVKVNGVTDINFTGDTQATANAYISNVRFGINGVGSQAGSDFYLDDIALNDASGSFQNSYPGTGGVYLLRPNGDGAHSDWTPSAGVDHYALVDEVPKNTTDYVSDDVSGHKDTYTLQDLPAEVTAVALVEVLFQAALAQAGSQSVKDVLRHSGVDYSGAAQAVTTEQPNYALFKGAPYYEVAGSTGAWSPAQVNALEAGVEIA